jgi:hypothetical protein
MMPMQQYQPAPMQQMPQGGYYGQPGLAQQTQQIQYAAPTRSNASGDRLPAMPEMMQRPTAPVAQLRQPAQQPMVRGGAPEVAQQPIAPPAPSSPGWQPIRIPSPAEMGIATTVSLPAKPEVTMPAQYDLTTVTNWLDQQDVRHMQRKKLAEGYQFSCQVDEATPAILVRGVTEAEALQQLVREVVKQKQNLLLSQR